MSAAPGPVRVLLVDDSAVIRRFVTETLQEAPDLVVSATAPNGQVALDRLEQSLPDVVVLDVEMPVLDGLATLARLRSRWPDLPVVMYSTLTERGATATLDALALGATDYVLKPSQLRDQHAASQNVLKELAPVVRSWGNVRRARQSTRRAVTVAPPPGPARPAPPRVRPEAVVIGCSTGGPQALTEVIPQLPASLGVPVLLVQHMPPLFTKLLAERLNGRSELTVCEASPGMLVEPGHVYVAPGGVHLVARKRGAQVELQADDGPPENSCKPAVDVLFRSAVEVWGPRLLAVVLTGMGHDGLEGARKVTEAGGGVLVQDEPTSVVWGMPGAISRAGLAGGVLPLSEIPGAIVRQAGRARAEVPA